MKATNSRNMYNVMMQDTCFVEVMRPHVLVHPRPRHQSLPEVSVEEEIEECPTATAEEDQQVGSSTSSWCYVVLL